MTCKLYVGNVSYDAKEEDLNTIFSEFGEVASVKIVMDRMTGKARGFAFVEMGTEDAAQSAIQGLDGKETLGRALRVSMAMERDPNSAPRKRNNFNGGPRNGDRPRRHNNNGGGRSRNNGNSNGNRAPRNEDNFGNTYSYNSDNE